MVAKELLILVRVFNSSANARIHVCMYMCILVLICTIYMQILMNVVDFIF